MASNTRPIEADQLKLELLKIIDEAGPTGVDSREAARKLGVEHTACVGCMKSLEMANMVVTKQGTVTMISLTEEGSSVGELGSSEYRVYEMVKSAGGEMTMDMKSGPKWQSLGLSQALRMKWLVTKPGGVVSLVPKDGVKDGVKDEVREVVSKFGGVAREEGWLNGEGVSSQTIQALIKRKLMSKSSQAYFMIQKGPEFALELKTKVGDITKEMILSGQWRDAEFKEYNFEAFGKEPSSGSIHPLINTLNMFRNILIQMGFEEMETQRWVESSFWNFDALFQPQSHPVRDAHDTFFLTNPSTHLPFEAGSLNNQYFDVVKKTHEMGIGDSLGWDCDWSEAEARTLILRTHTTAITSQVLRKLAVDYQKTGKFKTPARYFSIDRVFRNETLDATHLAEFHQVEGVVIGSKEDHEGSLSQLMGIIRAFFQKIGIDEIKFKPAYNPYTEPSMEIFGYHPILKKWTEIGNSGVFRPEMLKPMGLPDNISVLGWGLSLERPTMIARDVKDIRLLFGPKAKLSVF